MKIYVASSWRNERQPLVVQALRDAGHEVYDFCENGFHWSQIDPNWEAWTPAEMRAALDHPVAIEGYRLDYAVMEWAEAFVYLLPCGRSASLEAGWGAGKGKPTAALLSDGDPELMYRLVDCLCVSIEELVEWAAMVHRIDKFKAENNRLRAVKMAEKSN